jgi:DNA polymerase-1
MNRLLLVDGHNLLFKAFYGVPEKILSNGKPVQGIIGFIGITVKFIRNVEPTHLLVVFDPEEKPSRIELYSQYKQNRQDFSNSPERENPFSQLIDIKRALDNLGIRFCEQAGCEADDLIASYTAQSSGEVVIASTDTDFLQLVNERTSVYRYHGKKSVWFNESMVLQRYGVHPSRFLEYKSLIGDKSDTIAGVKGIGPKTAIKVLDNRRGLTPVEQVIFERNKGLIKLNTEVNLPYHINQLSFSNKLEDFKIGAFLRGIGAL